MDANVLVSFLTDRNPVQQERADELLGRAARGEITIFVHQVVLAELVYVLGNFYDLSNDAIGSALRKLLSMPGITPLDELSWPLLLDLWPAEIPDFADAVQAAVALRNPSLAIATFDRKLTRALSRIKVTTLWH